MAESNKKNNDKKKKKDRDAKLRRQAKRDIKVANKPLLNAIEREQDKGKDLYEADTARLQDIYGRLNQTLGQITPGITSANQNILNSVNSALGGMGGLNVSPQVAGLLGNIGASRMAGAGVAGMNATNVLGAAQGASALTQADLESSVLRDFNDLKDSLKDEKLDVKRDMTAQILARMEELRQRRKENRLAGRELELREEVASKDHRFRKKEQQRANKESQAARNYAETKTEAALDRQEQKQEKRRIRKIKDDIAEWEAKLKDVNRKITTASDGITGGPSRDLLERKRRLKRNIKDAEKRIKKVRN